MHKRFLRHNNRYLPGNSTILIFIPTQVYFEKSPSHLEFLPLLTRQVHHNSCGSRIMPKIYIQYQRVRTTRKPVNFYDFPFIIFPLYSSIIKTLSLLCFLFLHKRGWIATIPPYFYFSTTPTQKMQNLLHHFLYTQNTMHVHHLESLYLPYILSIY